MYMFEAIISLVYLILCLRDLKPSILENKAFIWDLNRSFNSIVIYTMILNPIIFVKSVKCICKSNNLIMNLKSTEGKFNFHNYTTYWIL